MNSKTTPPQNDQEGDLIIRDENIFTDMAPKRGDVSARALSIARIIDRLPPGKYFIEIDKHGVKAQPWDICAYKTEKVQEKQLP